MIRQFSSRIDVGVAYIFFSTIVWGSAFAVLKLLLLYFTPIEAITYRFMISALVFLLAVFHIGRAGDFRKVSFRDFALFILLIVLTMDVSALMWNYGLLFTTATRAGFVGQTTAIFMVIYSFLFLKEKIEIRKVLGVVSGFAGAAILATNGQFVAIYATPLNVGDFLVLLGSALWGVYMVAVKPILTRHHWTVTGTIAFGLGGLAMMPLLQMQPSSSRFPIGFEAIALLTWSGVVVAYLGNFLYYKGIRTTETSVAAVITNFSPLFSTLFAFLLIGELDILSLPVLVGGSLIVAGTSLVTLRQAQQ